LLMMVTLAAMNPDLTRGEACGSYNCQGRC
jgi:hypothetical protein